MYIGDEGLTVFNLGRRLVHTRLRLRLHVVSVDPRDLVVQTRRIPADLLSFRHLVASCFYETAFVEFLWLAAQSDILFALQ
jgi:hypothetical protein